MSEKSPERYRFRLHVDGTYVDLTSTSFVIGRKLGCHLRLDQELVSRRHARLVENDRGLWVEDLKSLNGVYVNQLRVTAPTLVGHGDTITIGRTTFDVVDLQAAPYLSSLPAEGATPTTRLPFDLPTVLSPESTTLAPRVDVLSSREREVLLLVLRGHTQQEIADQLAISVKTVESHRAHISEKLGCRTRAELVAYAISAGLIRIHTAQIREEP